MYYIANIIKFCAKCAKIHLKKSGKMHEYSVINALIEQCEEYARDNNAYRIDEIVISIGQRSGIDSALLESAFETFKEESPLCQTATLHIQQQKITLKCHTCQSEFEPNEMQYSICTKCGSNNVTIVNGQDMMLLSLSMQSHDT